MKEITIKVPEGWFIKCFTVIIITVAALMSWPHYNLYCAKLEAQATAIQKEAIK